MRFDHTQWLIHFVRNRISEQDFPGEEEDEMMYFASGELEVDADAFSVLQTIIRLGGLLPGYSFRGGRTTIYGGKPAVCATEMPIYSFSKYVRERNQPQKVSAYGIAFLKNEFYQAGGRPVIYGLSSDNVQYEINQPYQRILRENVLPKHEQYRYAAYNPGEGKWIDWSHEREWRWIPTNEEVHRIWAIDGEYQYDFLPGLPLFSGKKNGGSFSKLGIIVWNKQEAKLIQEMLTGFYIAGYNNYDSPFSRTLISHSFIILLDNVIDAVENNHLLEAQTIEGIKEEDLIEPVIIFDDTESFEPLIKMTIDKAKQAGGKAASKYLQHYEIERGSCGYANIISYEVTNPIVQHLIKMDIGTGPFDGKIAIYIKGDWPLSQSIDYNEHVAKAMCDVFNSDLANIFYCEARLD